MTFKQLAVCALAGGFAAACTASEPGDNNLTFTSGDGTGTDTGFAEDTGDEDTGTETGVMCTEPLVECGGECVDLDIDLAHCGACDNGCAEDEQCETGVCTGKMWRGAELLEFDDAGNASAPEISCDADGNAVVVWSQSDGSPLTHIGAIRYLTESNSWANAKPIEFDNAGGAFKPEVTVSSGGDAVAVWEQGNGGSLQDALTNRYDPTTDAWGSVEQLETNSAGDASNPQIAAAGNGTAFAVWTQTSGSNLNVWSNRYHLGTGTWLGAELIEQDDIGAAFFPQIAADGAGNAIAVWFQWDGLRNNIWSNRYDTTTDSWGLPELVETDDTGTTGAPQVVANANGDAVIIWTQNDGEDDNIWVRTFDTTTLLWGVPTLIEDEAGDASRPQIAISDTGDIFATWMQYDNGRFNVWFNSYSSFLGTWGRTELLETDDAGNAWDPQVSVGANDNVVFVWAQGDGIVQNIWAKRFDAATKSWSGPTALETDDAGDAELPQVATDANGNAYVTWIQFDGARTSLYANVFR